MKKLFTLLTFGLWSFAISAATYFASPEGGGNGTSVSSPVTFAQGLKKLSAPGDTLYLLSGQYDLGKTTIQNLNGSASKRIVIAGYEGINRSGTYAAILDFRTTAYGTRGLQISNTCTYLHIKNLTLRYSGKNNLYNEGNYNLFENLDIYGSADSGCQMKNAGNNIIKNVDSHDNFDYEHMSNGVADFGGNADGFADKQFTGAGNHYIGCRAWNNSDDGWDFFQRVSTSTTIIEECVCYANGAPYYDMREHPRALGVDKDWFDSKVGTQMTDRYGNTIAIRLDQYPCQGNGNGFKMGGGYTDHKVIVHHCLAVGNYARGFDQNNNDGTMWIYNNTGYVNDVNFGFTTAYGTNTIQNCISLSGKNKDGYKAKNVIAIDHNSWNTGYSCSATDFLSTDVSLVLAPRQSDGSLPNNDFMHLKEGSSLIDAGIDINLGYNGLAPDLGCYEYPGERHDPTPEDTIPEEQPEGTHSVAYVTLIGATEDKALLKHLRTNAGLWVVETDATDPSVDYSSYEVIVISSKPNSGAAGLAALKEVNKPMVVLKPFLFKQGAWGWGTAVNTQDLSVAVSQSEHPLFRGLTITDGKVQLFSQCNTNAVTAMSSWSDLPASFSLQTLATPVSLPNADAVTILSPRHIMIGVSEYSTSFLTQDAKLLIENAILYLLGMNIPTDRSIQNSSVGNQHVEIRKYLDNGKLFIQMGETVYDATGRAVH